MQLTCKTSGSKPAADIRWFKNDKEIKGKAWGALMKLLLLHWVKTENFLYVSDHSIAYPIQFIFNEI